VATLVSFHAHPDDEAIPTGGTLAKAADAGHRVVIVFATQGEHGETPEGLLEPGEELWQRRIREARRSAEILGADRVEFLGYRDSGMMGWPQNEAPESFWQADVEEAAGKLRTILSEERADIVTVYDAHGTYGHPDHIQVHRVGLRATELAGTPLVFEATANRDHVLRSLDRAREMGIDLPADLDAAEMAEFGMPEAELTTEVDVHDYLDRKRAAMAAHASQISDTSFFLSMPPEAFADAFGTEWFIRRGASPGIAENDLFAGLDPETSEGT
jgi:LmbE family N-acetylglucosaminyl deacetylase